MNTNNYCWIDGCVVKYKPSPSPTKEQKHDAFTINVMKKSLKELDYIEKQWRDLLDIQVKYKELINSVSGCYHTDEDKHNAALKYIRQSSKETW